MSELQQIPIDIYRLRFERIVGQPAWFYARDVMVNPHGDMADVPPANYQRVQSDNGERRLVVSGVIEGVGQVLTPQYLCDPTEEAWVVFARHADVATETGGQRDFAKNVSRAIVRLDRVSGWYETAEDIAPEVRGLAA